VYINEICCLNFICCPHENSKVGMDRKITNFFTRCEPPENKRPRTEPSAETAASDTDETALPATSDDEQVEDPVSTVSSKSDEEKDTAGGDWPSCWTLDQKIEYCRKYDWLFVCNQNLGCELCRKVGCLGVEAKMGMKIATEWASGTVTFSGENPRQQLRSLRKKICVHKESSSHKAAQKLVAEADKGALETVVLKAQSQERTVTAKVFRTAYKVAKENQSFHNFESEIDLQELNDLDMGRILHSTNACINIVNHTAKEMRKNLTKKIVSSNSKISLIIDESTTLSNVSTLILYLRTCVANTFMTSPVNLFLDLIELQSVTARGIVNSLLATLLSYGMTEEYLRNNLICVACDGAAVMVERKSGLKKLMSEQFPSVIFWHCVNHRLELAVAGTVKEVSGINRFKAFIDKLYALYHASPKNSRELQICANLLEVQLLKVGRILSTRWVASSFRSVSAVWENYEALVEHFDQAKQDTSRDQKERCMYQGLQCKITSTEFVLDLALMCDALQELSELSLELQDRSVDLQSANQKIKSLVQVFKERRVKPGPYYEMAAKAAEGHQFQGAELHSESRMNDPPINTNTFYTKLCEPIENRLILRTQTLLNGHVYLTKTVGLLMSKII